MISFCKKYKFCLFTLIAILIFSGGNTFASDNTATRPVFSVGDPSSPERIEIFYSPTCPDCFLAFRNAVANLIDKEIRRGEILLTLYLMPRSVDDIKIGAWLSCVPTKNFGPLMLKYMTARAYGFEYSEEDLLALIREHGATVESLDQCLTEPKINQLKQLNSVGINAGIDDTPGWIVREKLHQRVYFYWQIRELLKKN